MSQGYRFVAMSDLPPEEIVARMNAEGIEATLGADGVIELGPKALEQALNAKDRRTRLQDERTPDS
jgi:hypothetical protein